METIQRDNAANHTLSRTANTTKIGFQISKQIIVTRCPFITLHRSVWLYEASVANSLLGNHGLVNWTAVPNLHQCVWGSGARSRAPAHQGPHVTSQKCCLSFHQHNEHHKLFDKILLLTWNRDVISSSALIDGWHRFQLSYNHRWKWEIHECIC